MPGAEPATGLLATLHTCTGRGGKRLPGWIGATCRPASSAEWLSDWLTASFGERASPWGEPPSLTQRPGLVPALEEEPGRLAWRSEGDVPPQHATAAQESASDP